MPPIHSARPSAQAQRRSPGRSSTLRVADSEENRARFGGPSGERGESGYPIVRIATLMALRSHILAAAEFGPYSESEIVRSASLWRAVPDNALVIGDR